MTLRNFSASPCSLSNSGTAGRLTPGPDVNHGAQTQRHPGGRARMVAALAAIQQMPRGQERAPRRKPHHSGHPRKPSSPSGEFRRANHPLAASANRGSKAGGRPPETSATRHAPNSNSGKTAFDKARRSARRNRSGLGTKLLGIPKFLPPAFSARHIAVAGPEIEVKPNYGCPLSANHVMRLCDYAKLAPLQSHYLISLHGGEGLDIPSHR